MTQVCNMDLCHCKIQLSLSENAKNNFHYLHRTKCDIEYESQIKDKREEFWHWVEDVIVLQPQYHEKN